MRSFQQFLLEYDRSKTVASLGQKFRSRLESDQARSGPKTPEDIVEYLEKGDPTTNHQYVQWLVKAYTNGSKLEDLVSRGHGALVKFETLKKKKLLPPDKTDIGKLDDLEALETLVDSINLPVEELKDRGKSEEILNNDEVRIVVPHNEAAARYYGQGTKWCTAADENNAFSGYNETGDLVIFIPKHPKRVGEKYQVHFEQDQWMNEKDREVKKGFLRKRFPSVDFAKIGSYTGHVDGEHDQVVAKEALLKRLRAGTVSLQRIVNYAANVIKDRWPEAEPYIMKDTRWAYHYTIHVVKGRWKEIEPTIMKDPKWMHIYAQNVVKGRWKEIEPTIMKDPQWAFEYVYRVIKDRWPEAEPYIMKDAQWAYHYAIYVIKDRWPEAEPYIMKDPQWAYSYAQNVIKGRWPEAEPYIMKNLQYVYHYAQNVIKGRWPEAEPHLMEDPIWMHSYKGMLRTKDSN